MLSKSESESPDQDNQQKIKVSPNGPYLISGGIPLIEAEIRDDSEGYCHIWHEIKQYPVMERYALYRCGHSGHKHRNLDLQRYKVLYVCGNHSSILSRLDGNFRDIEIR